MGLWVKGGGERENRLRALRTACPHTVGYIGGCDEEQGEIETSWRRRERIFISPMASDRKLKASRKGSTSRIYGA